MAKSENKLTEEQSFVKKAFQLAQYVQKDFMYWSIARFFVELTRLLIMFRGRIAEELDEQSKHTPFGSKRRVM